LPHVEAGKRKMLFGGRSLHKLEKKKGDPYLRANVSINADNDRQKERSFTEQSRNARVEKSASLKAWMREIPLKQHGRKSHLGKTGE